jgi:hypothetical protein
MHHVNIIFLNILSPANATHFKMSYELWPLSIISILIGKYLTDIWKEKSE